MKKLLKCRVTLFVILGWVLFSGIGYIGKDDIYRSYQHDIKKTPYFVAVLEGIHDGVYPWDMKVDVADVADVVDVVDDTTDVGRENDVADNTVVLPEETEPEQKEFIQVDESYFDDAVFIGDSRTVGLRDYGGLDTATFYATVGLNVYDMWTKEYCEVEGEKEKVTLEEALSARQFGKVYFQIGINEMGRGTIEGFIEEYTAAVQKIRMLQPNAIIYVQGIMRVTREKSESDEIFNNKGILLRNDRIAQLADNESIFYIDMNEVVCDNTGNLKEELTFDNLHLYAASYGVWVDFLKSKGIEM